MTLIKHSSLKQRPKFRSIAFSVLALMFGFLAGLSTNNSLSGGDVQKTIGSISCAAVSEDDHPPPPPQQQQQQQQGKEDCSTRLDALDATFNERRRMRAVRAAKQEKPPVIVQFFDMFEPEAVCFTDERFGSLKRYDAFGDGPKFVCGIDYLRETTTTTTTNTHTVDDNNPCLVYSVGSNNQIAFEKSVTALLPGCEIHTFDPTLDKPYIGDAYSTFHPWGFGEDNSTISYRKNKPNSSPTMISFVTKSFKTVIQELGHEGRRIHILKIDCEGCEYTAMVPLFDAIVRNEVEVDQILIEMHNVRSWEELPGVRWKRIVQWFEAADRAKMRIFHKERNQWGCDGAYCVEYALVSEDFLRRSNAQIVCGSTGQ